MWRDAFKVGSGAERMEMQGAKLSSTTIAGTRPALAMRWSVMIMAMVALLATASAQAAAASGSYNCAASIKTLPGASPLQSGRDPCANTTAYTQLSSCRAFINGNVSTPSADCCASAHDVWAKNPACFCKVTFFSIFSPPGPARALERPHMCNITDDLCNVCPLALVDYGRDYEHCIKTKYKEPAKDPCADTMAYSQLGTCSDFINGNVTTPSADCCESSHDVWSKYPACFCKVTFFSIFPAPGPAQSLVRPYMCNITDDLCKICPAHLGK